MNMKSDFSIITLRMKAAMEFPEATIFVTGAKTNGRILTHGRQKTLLKKVFIFIPVNLLLSHLPLTKQALMNMSLIR